MGCGRSGGHGYGKLEVSLKHPSGDVEEAIEYKSDESEREFWCKNIHLRIRGTCSTLSHKTVKVPKEVRITREKEQALGPGRRKNQERRIERNNQ